VPVKTEFGYHIITVSDKKKGTPVEFDKIRDMISQKLSGEKQKGAFDLYVAELKKNYKVEINKDALMKSSSGTEKKEAPPAEPDQPKKAGEEQNKKK
jgi:parvulin-like peptidyl-prolyl isomerase